MLMKRLDIERAKRVAAQEVLDEDFNREVDRQKVLIRTSPEYQIFRMWQRRKTDKGG